MGKRSTEGLITILRKCQTRDQVIEVLQAIKLAPGVTVRDWKNIFKRVSAIDTGVKEAVKTA